MASIDYKNFPNIPEAHQLFNNPKSILDRDIEDINRKLDKIISLLTKPNSIIVTGPEVQKVMETLNKKP